MRQTTAVFDLRRRPAFWLAVVGAMLTGFAFVLSRPNDQNTETEALRQRVQALEARQASFEAELRRLEGRAGDAAARISSRSPVPATSLSAGVAAVVIGISGAPYKGRRDAPLVLVEFSDYQCGFCGRHARETLPLIDAEFVRPGNVRYVFRSFPNEARHPLALKAHEAAACAGDQERYWEMHGRLFARPAALQPAALRQHAAGIGLAPAAFQQCVDSSRHRDGVRRDIAIGREAGVTATPTFLLGVPGDAPDRVRVVEIIRGAKPFRVFQQTIKQILTTRQ